MSDNDNFPFWNDAWMQAQADYWNAWQSLAGTTNNSTASAGESNPWVQALEQWKSMFSTPANGDNADIVQKLLQQGQAFCYFGGEIMQFLKKLCEINEASENWQEMLRTRFNEIKSSFEQMSGTADAMSGLSAFVNLPLDTWQRTVSSASLLPGDLFQEIKPETLGAVSEQVEKFLSVPGIGYTRESQEQMQESVRLWLNYQRAFQEYSGAHRKLGITSLEKLLERIINKTENNEEITSLREVYDLWVECNEAAFAEFAFTEEYSATYGQMVNALMALKHHGRAVVDETLGALGMPTRRGLDTIQRRQHEMRREVTKLKKTANGGDLRSIANEVSTLRKELQSTMEKKDREIGKLREQIESLQARVPPDTASKSAVSKKKTTARAASRRSATKTN